MKYFIVILSYGLFVFWLASCKENSQNNLNKKASFFSNELSINPLLKKVLTTKINTKNNTMSTLYGNKIAWEYAKTNLKKNYPAGAILCEVTWKQKPDTLWFGARIPDKIVKIEVLKYSNNNQPLYSCYTGNPLKRSNNFPNNLKKRIIEISSQKVASTP